MKFYHLKSYIEVIKFSLNVISNTSIYSILPRWSEKLWQ